MAKGTIIIYMYIYDKVSNHYLCVYRQIKGLTSSARKEKWLPFAVSIWLYCRTTDAPSG